MYGCHEASLDPELSTQHLRGDRKTVRRARTIAHDRVFLCIVQLVIDPHVDGDVFPLGRGADDDSLRTALKMTTGFVGRGETTGRFHYEIDLRVIPLDDGRITLRKHTDRRIADHQLAVAPLHLSRERPIVRV